MRTLILLVLLAIASASLHAQTACGYISASAKPPQSEGIYPADIVRIDGQDVPKRALKRYPLSVGKHRIALQEQVASTPRGYTLLRKLGNKATAVVLKIIEIDVKANTNHQLGAKLDKAKIDRKQPDAFWEPVVWKETAAACR